MLLSLHIAAGALGLLLGPLAIAQEQHPPFRSRVGLAYACAVVAVGLTAVALVAQNPDELWWLAPLGILSVGLALLGRAAPGWDSPAWSRAYAHGQGGSYNALVTAFLVVSVDGPAQVAAWIAPTFAGVALIEWRARILSRGQNEASQRAPSAAARWSSR